MLFAVSSDRIYSLDSATGLLMPLAEIPSWEIDGNWWWCGGPYLMPEVRRNVSPYIFLMNSYYDIEKRRFFPLPDAVIIGWLWQLRWWRVNGTGYIHPGVFSFIHSKMCESHLCSSSFVRMSLANKSAGIKSFGIHPPIRLAPLVRLYQLAKSGTPISC